LKFSTDWCDSIAPASGTEAIIVSIAAPWKTLLRWHFHSVEFICQHTTH